MQNLKLFFHDFEQKLNSDLQCVHLHDSFRDQLKSADACTICGCQLQWKQKGDQKVQIQIYSYDLQF